MKKKIKSSKGITKVMQMKVEQKEQEFTPITFGEFAKSWFDGEYSHRVTAATLKKSQYYLDKHVLPYFNDRILQEVTVIDIGEFHSKKRQEQYSESTLYGITSFLSTLFRVAIEKGILDEQPMKGMMKKVINKSKRTIKPWSNEEVTKLLEAAEKEGSEVMYKFVLSTGVRLGELLALSWDDIDFDKKCLTIKKNVAPIGNEQIEQIRSDFRTITLPSDIIAKLKEHKGKQQLIMEELGEQYHCKLKLVFPNNNGGIQSPSVVRANFYRLIDKANVPKITFHDLRKMHAIVLFRAGVSPEIIKNRLGHMSIETTLKKFCRLG